MRYRSKPELEDLKLGDYNEAVEVQSRAEVSRATNVLAAQAHRTIEVVSRDLETRIYGHPEFIGAATRMVLDSRRARLRFLVQNPGPAISAHHPLIETMRRLASFIEIRVPADEYANFNEAFMIVDSLGVVQRLLADRYEGTVHFNARSIANDLGRQFELMWESANPHPGLRRLHV